MEILGGDNFKKIVGDCVIEQKNTLLKNIMIKVHNLHLTRHHGISNPGNLEQTEQRLGRRTQIGKGTNKQTKNLIQCEWMGKSHTR